MKATRHHIASLDVFRGLTVAAMIVVNNPGNWGDVFPALMHSDWNGCTLADLVFPFFVFIMGVAMPLAFARRGGPEAAGRLQRRVWTRAALLILLGLVLNAVAAWPHVTSMRIPGVLQRIALTYLGASFIVLYARADRQAAIAVALLAVHWAILAWVPFDGWAAGTLLPEHNVAASLDARIFGAHLLTAVGDPEVFSGPIPSVATALAGAMAGNWLRTTTTDRARMVGLGAGGAAALLVGFAWSYVLPVNKALWTGLYALLTSGLAAWSVAVCYFVVDVRRSDRRARPFLWLGVNPLAIYFLAEFVGHVIEHPWIGPDGSKVAVKDVVFWQWFAPLFRGAEGPWLSFVYALIYASLWIGVAGVFYRRGIRVKV